MEVGCGLIQNSVLDTETRDLDLDGLEDVNFPDYVCIRFGPRSKRKLHRFDVRETQTILLDDELLHNILKQSRN